MCKKYFYYSLLQRLLRSTMRNRNVLNPSLLLLLLLQLMLAISCKIINDNSSSWLARILLKYSNTWEICVRCLLWIIFLLLLIYWLISTSLGGCCCCRFNTFDWRLLMMCSVRIRMPTYINTPRHKINLSFYRLWLFTPLWRRKNWANEARDWWFYFNSCVSPRLPNR